MDDKNKIDPIRSEISADSTWKKLCDDSYFFVSDRESSILSEFGWNLHPDTAEPSGGGGGDAGGGFREIDRIDAGEISDLAGNNRVQPESSTVQAGSAANASTSNPSVSSGSSEDPPENSTASGGKPPTPPETAGKVRKTGQKRVRQQRFAFMTKSEVDHLEDGYRWRKYGQKAVKNSPYPRSYYRCTNSKCTVKKRVERSYEDPTIVITTYEGQHCHHTVGLPRGGLITPHEASFPGHLHPAVLPQFYNYQGVQFTQEGSHTVTQSRSHQGRSEEGESRHLPSQATSHLPTDEGLLGDMVPPGMRNQ